MRIPDFIFVSPILDPSGIAETMRNLYLALFDLGVKIKIMELPMWSHLKVDLNPELREKIQFGIDRNDLVKPVVLMAYPPHHFVRYGTPHIEGASLYFTHTVFETNKAPLMWREFLNDTKFVENFVNCPFNINAYASVGINKDKLRVLTLGVDTDKFNPQVTPMNIDGKKEFNFMTGFDWSVRKNPEGLIASYMQEFTNDPEVCLIVKSYTGYADENSKNFIREQIKKLRLMTRSKANVLLMTDFIHSDLMPNFHKAADVWINLSRGEGHSLPVLQSMACGVPVIGSDSTAHQMYLNEQNGYPVPCSSIPINNQDFLARTPEFLGSSWWEPNIKEARKQMRQAYNDWKSGKLKEKGVEARKESLNFNWKKTAIQLIFECGKYMN